MAFNDIREYIDKLKETGDVVFVEQEVDWDLEAGAIIRRSNETGSPAPFFQKIKDCPPGFRLLGGPVATFRRLAIAFGLDPDTPFPEILDNYEKRMQNPIKPVLVSTGPCKENILLGDEVDLSRFPAPILHAGDGGRYIGTWHIVATKDMDSGWLNYGMYRVMIHDKNTMGILLTPHQHVGMIFSKYEEKNVPMEIAIAIAPEPITTFVGTCGVPAGVSEVDIIGGFRGEPLEVVKCETVDLVVPARTEIVIEGVIRPGNVKEEGPFGEYTGYSAGGRSPRPVIEVTAITHRNDPIITSCCAGYPIEDNDTVLAVSWGAAILADLKKASLPVTGIYIPPESSGCICVVAIKNIYSNIAGQVAACVWANKNGKYIPRVIVVEDDIDPTDMKQVIFAFATKCHPKNGTMLLENMPGAPLIPFVSREERVLSKCSNVVYDCTWPHDWAPENVPILASFKKIYPENIQKKVLSNWENYGFK
jgi:phenylphosphate carboxylase alpha subunit